MTKIFLLSNRDFEECTHLGIFKTKEKAREMIIQLLKDKNSTIYETELFIIEEFKINKNHLNEENSNNEYIIGKELINKEKKESEN